MSMADVTGEIMDAAFEPVRPYVVRFATVYGFRQWVKKRREVMKILREGFPDVRVMVGGWSPFTRFRPIELIGRRQRVRAAGRALLRRLAIVLAAPGVLAGIRGDQTGKQGT